MINQEFKPSDERLLRKTAIRIIKDIPGIYGIPPLIIDADFYCRLLTEESHQYETELEYVFYVEHMELTDACLITVELNEDASWHVKDIICEGKHINFSRFGLLVEFTFEISGLSGKTRTLYIHTLIKEAGLTLRIEQNDARRVAGAYRSNPYPYKQIIAAQHYIFAVREILHLLRIPEYLSKSGLGYILLLGFETNNEKHGDYPPHWHLIYRWPTFCGSQAPHIYLDDQGKMMNNLMCVDCIPKVRYNYERNEWWELVDMYGRSILRCRIDEEGGMTITKDDQPLYTLSALTDKGVYVYRESELIENICVNNDTITGVLTVKCKHNDSERWAELIKYDPITGEVLLHQKTGG
ncbi:MAG: hypothetical protein IJJ80_02500 [Clostridia bacterium]|nr:hypothetical protein [Clostridia bacterium]